MSRFLERLIDRAEGRAPVLQRRPRALFEAQNSGGPRQLESFEQHDVHARSRASTHAPHAGEAEAPRQPLRVAHRPQPDRVEPTTTVNLQAPETVVPRARHDGEPTRRGSLLADHAPSVRRRAAPDPEPGRIPAEAKQHAPPVEQRESRGGIADHALMQERTPVRPAVPVTEPRPSVPRERGRETPAPVRHTTTIIERAQTSPAAKPGVDRTSGSRSAVLLAKAQTAALVRRERPAVASPAPVQITIGRVEVRAVSGRAERSHGSAPAAPRLSLDEYLRQRNGAPR